MGKQRLDFLKFVGEVCGFFLSLGMVALFLAWLAKAIGLWGV